MQLFTLSDKEQSWPVRTPLVVEPKKIWLGVLYIYKMVVGNDFTGVCLLDVLIIIDDILC